MARARNIKPGYFTSDDPADCEPLARILFAGLWCWGDREGRIEERPKKLKAEILPYDRCDVEKLLEQLAVKGFIKRYERNGSKYIQVLNFHKHQNPHVKEPKSTIPPPESTEQEPGKNSASPADSGTSRADSLIPHPSSLIPHPDSLKPVPGTDPEPDPSIDEIVSAWNATKGVVHCRDVSVARRRAVKTRLKEPGWDWRGALAKFPLRVTTSDPGGWKPDIDWFLRPDSVTKILEGKYDWEKSNGQRKLNIGAGQRFDDGKPAQEGKL
jgi:hypothetical protein